MFAVNFAEYLLKRNLQHLIVHVTNHCNFRCQHCFIDFSHKRDLKLDTFRQLGQDTGPLFWLDIGGGEPFLRKDLVEIIGSFRAKVIQIPTNGSLPDRILPALKRLKSETDAELAISFSIDGLEYTHEAIRKSKGNWVQVWDTFESVRSLGGIKIKVNTVLQILELMREARRREPDFHSIILLRGEPLNPEFGLPPLDEIRRLGPQIFKILEDYNYGKGGMVSRVLRNYHRYLWNISLQTIEKRTQVIPCKAGQAHMVVMGNGDVSSCEELAPVGNINDDNWANVMSSERLAAQRKGISNKECHCTHNCAMLDSILFRPRSIPHLLYEKVTGNE